MKYLIYLLGLSLFLVACSDTPPMGDESGSRESSLPPENLEEKSPIPQKPVTAADPEATVAAAPDALTGCACDIFAYVTDPDEETNVRDAPKGEIVNKFRSLVDDMEAMLHFKGSSNNWLQIDDGGEYPELKGNWIHGSLVAGDTRNYGGQKINLYKDHSKDSEVTASFSTEMHFNLYGCCEDWVYVKGKDAEGKALEGWMEAEMWCSSPVTNCN